MPVVLNSHAVVLCTHGGKCLPVAPDPRVKIAGAPVVSQAAPWVVAGCSIAGDPMAGMMGGGCQTVSFVTGSIRVRVNGKPLLLETSVGIANPAGAPVKIVMAGQVRVKAM
jgi:hypothetical protein